jgi:hypothetical protein
MTEFPPSSFPAADFRSRVATIGSQPVAVAATALLLIVSGICAVLLWRIATGTTPEQERLASGRQAQARVVQTSEQIMERTKGLELSQQESIDQLQVLRDQLDSIRQLLTAQRSESKRLFNQVGEISGNLDSLRQSFASTQTQATNADEGSSVRNNPVTSAHRGHIKKRRVARVHRNRGKARR